MSKKAAWTDLAIFRCDENVRVADKMYQVGWPSYTKDGESKKPYKYEAIGCSLGGENRIRRTDNVHDAAYLAGYYGCALYAKDYKDGTNMTQDLTELLEKKFGKESIQVKVFKEWKLDLFSVYILLNETEPTSKGMKEERHWSYMGASYFGGGILRQVLETFDSIFWPAVLGNALKEKEE